MKKYLFGIVCLIVFLAGTSFAQNRRADFSISEPLEENCSVAGTCYYVDNAVSSSGDGSSWNKAWKSFANINWSQINPGNVIYISGGTSGKSYNENLVVKASGTLGNQIKITKGVDAGHNGQVMFDGTGRGSTEAIFIRPTSCNGYVTISNLHFRNWAEACISVSGASGTTYSAAGAAKGVIVENNNIRIDGRAGVYIQTSNNITVRNNHITTPTWVNDQTDGIYSQRNRQNLYENNTIIISNQEPTEHDDCIQLANEDTDITIKGNYLEQNNSKTSNAQGIMASLLYGTTRIYGNIINLKSSSNALNIIGTGGNGTLECIGNTLFAKTPSHLFNIQDFNNPVIKNNIGVITENTVAPMEVVARYQSSIVYDPSEINHNLLWNQNTADIANLYGKGRLTQAELKAIGVNTRGLNVNPQFRDPANGNFTPLNPAVCTASDSGSFIGALPCN